MPDYHRRVQHPKARLAFDHMKRRINSSPFKSKFRSRFITFSGEKYGIDEFVLHPHIHISEGYQKNMIF